MGDKLEIIDSNFTLDWSSKKSEFNFYVDKFMFSKAVHYLLISLYALSILIISHLIVLVVLKGTPSYGEDSYLVYLNVFALYTTLCVCLISVLCLFWSIIEFLFVRPKFKINKSSKIYITDGIGFYIVDYCVGRCSESNHKYFPVIIDKIIENCSSIKFKREYFTDVVYMDNYNLISDSSSYLMLDIPEDNPIYDDLNDIEIPSTFYGFNEFREYIKSTEGGYYFDKEDF